MTTPHGYRARLQGVVAAGSAPYGYTLTLWTATAVASSARGAPTAGDALALLAGATLTFVAVGAAAHGGPRRPLTRAAPGVTPVWAALHLPTAGLAALLSRLLARGLSRHLLWGLVGATATAVYLLGAAAQLWCAGARTGRRPTPGPVPPPPTRGTAMTLMLDSAAQDLLFREARTANTFTDTPVTDEQVQDIYDLVKYGPTSMNQQPLRVVLVRSGDARARLVQHLAEGNKKKTETAPLVALLAADNEFHEELPTVFPHFPQAKDVFFAERSVRERSAALNAALQVGYFIIGVRAAGLAAGPMTGFDAEAVNKEFFPDGDHSVLAVVNIGNPGEDAWFARSPRLGYDEVVTTV
jgi:3-hydroxypropanoate dehydrogenase